MALTSVTVAPAWALAETVAVLDATIDGVPPEGRERLQGNLEDGLRGVGFTIVPHETVAERLAQANAAAGCAFGPCLRAVGLALGVQLVLVVRIVADGPSFSFVLTLVDTQSGTPRAQVTDACAVCTFDEAMGATTLAVVDLATRYRERVDTEAEAPLPGGAGRASEQRRRHRLPAWIMSGGAIIAAGVATVLFTRDDGHDGAGWAAAGAAGGLAIGAGLLLTFD